MALPYEPFDPAAERELPPGADPVAANQDSVTPIPPVVTAIPTTRNVLKAGWVTGATAGVICLILRGLGALFSTQFQVVRGPGASTADLVTVSWVMVLIVPIIAGLVGSLVAAIFLGVRGCQRWVFWLGTLTMVLSLLIPLTEPTPPVTLPTRIWLAMMHVLTWAIVVPQVARVVGDSDPRVTASYRDVVTPERRATPRR